MEKNKKGNAIQLILAILSLICLALGAIGYLNKDKPRVVPDNEITNPEEDVELIESDEYNYVGISGNIEKSSIIDTLEFVNTNNFNDGLVDYYNIKDEGELYVMIDNVDFYFNQKKFGRNKGHAITDVKISHFGIVKSVLYTYTTDNTSMLYIYILTDMDEVYRVMFNYKTGDKITVERLEVMDVEGIALVNSYSGKENEIKPSIVIKTKDQYYTDYSEDINNKELKMVE